MRIDRQYRRYAPRPVPTPISTATPTAKTVQDMQDTVLQLTRIVASLTTEVESLFLRVGRIEEAQARAQCECAQVAGGLDDERDPQATAPPVATNALGQAAPDAPDSRPRSPTTSTRPTPTAPPFVFHSFSAPPSYTPTSLALSTAGAESDWLFVEERASMPAPPSPSRAASPAFSLFGGASDDAEKGSEDEWPEQDEEEEHERSSRRPAPIATTRYGVVGLGRSMYVKGLSEATAVTVEQAACEEEEEEEEESALERIE